MEIQMILMGAFGAAIIAGSMYLKSRQAGEPFEPVKFVQTVVIGAISGGALGLSGITITTENVEAQMAAYSFLGGGIAFFVENIIKWIYRMRPLGTTEQPIIAPTELPSTPIVQWSPGFTVTPVEQKGTSPVAAMFTIIVGNDQGGKRCLVRVDWNDGTPVEDFMPNQLSGEVVVSHVYIYSQGTSKYSGKQFYPTFSVVGVNGVVYGQFNVDGKCCWVEVQSK